MSRGTKGCASLHGKTQDFSVFRNRFGFDLQFRLKMSKALE
jgi:hypothetical protein